MKLNGEYIINRYAVEEMSELTKELSKEERGQDNRDQILKELADVYYIASMQKQLRGFTDEEINAIIIETQLKARKALDEGLKLKEVIESLV